MSWCPCLCLITIPPPIPLKSPGVLFKVGLVLGECIVMCCCYLRYPILIIPHLYCSLYILLSIFSRSWAGFMFCPKLNFIPAVVINPLFILVQVLVMSVLQIVALCLHNLDQDAVIYVGLGNLEAFKAVNSVVESPLFISKRGFWLLCLQSPRVSFIVDRGFQGIYFNLGWNYTFAILSRPLYFPHYSFSYLPRPQCPCKAGWFAQSLIWMVLYACCRTGDLPELRSKLHLFFDCLIVLHNKVGRRESRLFHGTTANCCNGP